MACHLLAPNIIVCTTPSTRYRMMLRCPKCKTLRRFTRTFGGWYGDDIQCCGCGHEWSDGYLLRRLRTDKAKTEAKTVAAQRWKDARPAADYSAAVDEFMGIYCSPDDDTYPA